MNKEPDAWAIWRPKTKEVYQHHVLRSRYGTVGYPVFSVNDNPTWVVKLRVGFIIDQWADIIQRQEGGTIETIKKSVRIMHISKSKDWYTYKAEWEAGRIVCRNAMWVAV